MIKKRILTALLIVLFSLMIYGCDPVIDNGNNGENNNRNDEVSDDDNSSWYLPDSMTQEQYEQNLDAKYPQTTDLLGCQDGNSACLSQITNNLEMSFGDEVKVIIPEQSMKKDSVINPSIETFDEEETGGILYSLDFEDTDFLNYVKVEIPWPQDKNSEDYYVAMKTDEGYGEIKQLILENDKVFFYTNHFSSWDVLAQHHIKKIKELEPKYVDFSALLVISDDKKKETPAKKLAYELLLGDKVFASGYTDSNGNINTKITEYHMGLFNNGDIKVKLILENKMFDLVNQDNSKYSYTSSFITGKNINKAIFHVSDRLALNAIKILDHSDDIKNFWISKGSLEKGFLSQQIRMKYPDSDGSYYTPVTSKGLDKVGITYEFYEIIGVGNRDLDDYKNGDGSDTLAHEYAHFATKFIYGTVSWQRLSSSAAQHGIGEIVKPGDAFKEDIAYFTESVFDGSRKDSLRNVNIAKKMEAIENIWEKRKNNYVNAKNEEEKAKVLNKAKENYEYYNDLIIKFNEDYSQIDGFGAIVMWDLYENIGEQAFTQFWTILKNRKPLSFKEFVRHYQNDYPATYPQLNQSLTKMGAGKKYEELQKFWELACLSYADCDDNDPCTADMCVEGKDRSFSSDWVPNTYDFIQCSTPGDCEKPTCIHTRPTVSDSDNTIRKMYNPGGIPEECEDYNIYEECEYLCCDSGETSNVISMKKDRVEETTDCFGFGNGNPCISKFPVSIHSCCTDNDCKTSSNNDWYYEQEKASGYTEAKCVNNYCVYIKVLPIDAKVSCSTNQYDYTTCTYTVPEN